MSDRIVWNQRGGEIDELVIENPDAVHIEQMSDDCWWIGIYKGHGARRWAGNFTLEDGRLTFREQENDGVRWADDRSHDDG